MHHRKDTDRANSRKHALTVMLSALVAGVLFGFGLALSTMVQPEAIKQFLLLHNLGLLLVLGGASLTTMLCYQLLPRLARRPLFAQGWATRPAYLNRRTLIGAALFGVGWGLSGVCPGPALAGLGVGNCPLLLSVLGLLLGAWIEGRYFQRR